MESRVTAIFWRSHFRKAKVRQANLSVTYLLEIKEVDSEFPDMSGKGMGRLTLQRGLK